MTFPFEPDWCLAPAAHLRGYLEDNRLTERILVASVIPESQRDSAAVAVGEVLAKHPLTEDHARLLERCTHIPARMWLALEHNYRAGLAAGLTDVS